MKEYDALVVGAGILGLSTAGYLKLRNPRLQVLVADKLGAAGRGSTAKSAAALYFGEEFALLYGDRAFKVGDLGLKNRNIEPEKLII